MKSSVTGSIMGICGTAKSSGAATTLTISVNRKSDTTLLAGSIRIGIVANNGSYLIGGTDTNTGITDGKVHHLCATVLPSTNTIKIYVDGVSWAVTYNVQTPAVFENYPYNWTWAAINNTGTIGSYFAGAMGHAAIYNSVLTTNQVAGHYLAGVEQYSQNTPLCDDGGMK